MFEHSKKPFPPKSDMSRDMQVLRSIEAPSALSLEQTDT